MFSARRMISWARTLPRRIMRLPLWITIPSGLLLLALLGFGGYEGAAAYKYTQEDPQFCESCHIMQPAFQKWITSEHKNVNCHACHRISPAGGAGLILRTALLRPHEVNREAEVPPERCAACHESGNPQWKQVEATAGHSVHVEQQRFPCTTCHTPELHRFRPSQDVCLQCHKDTKVTHDGAAQQNCLTCHQYLHQGTEPRSLLPRGETCLECHNEQKDVKFLRPTAGHAQLDCTECHKPHQTDQPKVACASCHATVVAAPLGIHSLEGHQRANCQQCHQQPHQPKVALETISCQACHKTQPVQAPLIPHGTVGRSQCLLCHGAGKVADIPVTHVGRTEDTCLACHQS